MLVVAESLRQRWEKVFTRGTSLIQIRKDREEALFMVERSSKKSNLILNWEFVITMIFVLVLTCPVHTRVRHGLIDPIWAYLLCIPLFGLIVASTCWMRYLGRKIKVAQQTILDCEEIFSKLRQSVDSLNRLWVGNPHRDVIAEPQVIERLVRAAYRILDAQANFESCRMRQDAARYDVIRAGNWILHCEEAFDRIWDSSTRDFGLVLDKREIFKQASAELARNNAKGVPADS